MELTTPTPGGDARVDLRRPPRATALVVLTHGAGGDPDTADLRAAAQAAHDVGAAVALVTQAYRVAGRRTPPAPEPQDASWLAVINALRARRGLRSVPLVLGGRSNGARVACRTAGPTGAAGVLAIAFPLHPPGRPDRSRLPELDAPDVPVLVLQGERDPFGMPPAAPGRDVVVLAGDTHTLRRGLPVVAARTAAFVTSLVGDRSPDGSRQK